jgi:hypothetical protein
MLIKRAMKGKLIFNVSQNVAKELMGIPSFEIPDYSDICLRKKK